MKLSFLIILLSLIIIVDGLKIDKQILSGKSWKFFNRFTFRAPNVKSSSQDGRFDFDIYHNNNGIDNLFLLGYSYTSLANFVNDVKISSSAIYHKCSNLISKASYIQSISSTSSNCIVNTNDDLNVASYKYVSTINGVANESVLLSSSSSIMLWVMASCTLNPPDNCLYDQGPIDVYVQGHCYHLDSNSNNNGKRLTTKEISYESINMPTITTIFFVGHLILVIAMSYVRYLLTGLGKYHHTVKFLHISFLGYLFRYFFGMLYWLTYASRGQPNKGIIVTSDAFFILSDTSMIVFFMLLSGGWTIVRRKMKMIGRIRITFFAAAYLALSVIAQIWKGVTSDGVVINFYTSPPGILMLMLLVIAMFRIRGSVNTTLTNYPEQKQFFEKFRLLATFYTLRLPVVELIILGCSDISSVEIYTSVDCVVVFLCQSVLLAMFHPRLFPEQFPFHAKLDDMILYKLDKKKAESKKSEDDLADEQPKVISFTGGYGNAELIDEVGRVKPPSVFDRLQLSKLKEVVQNFGKRISSVSDHQKKMEAVLNAVSVEYSHVNVTDDEGEGKRSSQYRNINIKNRFYDNNRSSDSDTRFCSQEANSDSDNENINNAIKRAPPATAKKTNTSGKQFTPKVLPPTSRNPYLLAFKNDNNEGNLLSALDEAIINR